MTLYLSNIERVFQPQSFTIVPSSTPACRRLRAAQRRRSWGVRPKGGSPDAFDAVCLAFSLDLTDVWMVELLKVNDGKRAFW